MTKYGNWEDYFFDGSHYISKGAYYRNSSFLIYPTWEEVNRSILIPGDRWHPFCPSGLPPHDIKTIHGESLIPFRTINYTLEALEGYHTMLGKEILIMNLAEAASSHCDQFSLAVMDMRDFYRRHDFQVGDAIRVHVLDYHQGLYAAEYVNQPEKGEWDERANSWLSLMEASMHKVIALFGDKLILPRQIDWAFFMGGRRLLSRPSANIRYFLRHTNQFTVAGRDGVYFLRKK